MGYNLILNPYKSVNIKVWHESKMSAAERLFVALTIFLRHLSDYRTFLRVSKQSSGNGLLINR